MKALHLESIVQCFQKCNLEHYYTINDAMLTIETSTATFDILFVLT